MTSYRASPPPYTRAAPRRLRDRQPPPAGVGLCRLCFDVEAYQMSHFDERHVRPSLSRKLVKINWRVSYLSTINFNTSWNGAFCAPPRQRQRRPPPVLPERVCRGAYARKNGPHGLNFLFQFFNWTSHTDTFWEGQRFCPREVPQVKSDTLQKFVLTIPELLTFFTKNFGQFNFRTKGSAEI